MTTQQHLLDLRACANARQWASSFDSWEKIIGKCYRPDWLLWPDERLDILSDKERRMLAVHFVRSTPLADGRVVYDLLTDQRSRDALDVAERFAHGRATADELDAARSAAMSAAWGAAWGAAWEHQAQHIRSKYGKRFVARLNKDYPVTK